MRQIFVVVAALFLLGGQALAESPPERLIAHYPTDWKPQPAVAQGPMTVVQLLPPNASPQAFDEAIVVQRIDGSKESPKALVSAQIDGSRKNCEGLQVGPLDEAAINGYKAATVRFACTKSTRTGKSGLMMVVAVAGKDAVHVIQRMWLGAPVGANEPVPVPDTVIAAWDVFAAGVTVCDTRDPKHPCPSDKPKK